MFYLAFCLFVCCVCCFSGIWVVFLVLFGGGILGLLFWFLFWVLLVCLFGGFLWLVAFVPF